VPRGERPVILVFLLALDHQAGAVDLRVPAEARSITVAGDDPAAVGDRHLTEDRAGWRSPDLRSVAERLACVLHRVVVGICVGVDGVRAGERGRVTELGLTAGVGGRGAA